jgi:hypothetical protein
LTPRVPYAYFSLNGHTTHPWCGSGTSRDALEANEDATEHEAKGCLRFQQGILIHEDEEIGKQLIYPF